MQKTRCFPVSATGQTLSHRLSKVRTNVFKNLQQRGERSVFSAFMLNRHLKLDMNYNVHACTCMKREERCLPSYRGSGGRPTGYNSASFPSKWCWKGNWSIQKAFSNKATIVENLPSILSVWNPRSSRVFLPYWAKMVNSVRRSVVQG